MYGEKGGGSQWGESVGQGLWPRRGKSSGVEEDRVGRRISKMVGTERHGKMIKFATLYT